MIKPTSLRLAQSGPHPPIIETLVWGSHQPPEIRWTERKSNGTIVIDSGMSISVAVPLAPTTQSGNLRYVLNPLVLLVGPLRARLVLLAGLALLTRGQRITSLVAGRWLD